MTPHLLSLNQDIVAWSQTEKCGVCNTQSRGPTWTSDISDLENGQPSEHMMSICRIFGDIEELT